MKITLFISRLYGGGTERVCCNLANYLIKKGNEVSIATVSESDETYELDKKVKIYKLLPQRKRIRILNTIIRCIRMWAYLIKTKTDVYVVMLPETILILLLFRWMTKAKVIASERCNPPIYSEKIRKYLKKYSGKADGFVFQTEEAEKWYINSLDGAKTAVIPNALNPEFIRNHFEGQREKNIVGVGRLVKQKNFSLLISAFSKIAPQYPDYKLIIYGEGQERKSLEKMVDELHLNNRVFLPGNYKNIADKIEKSYLFVLSSDFEGMPNALMEAMALGLPCISTDCPCGGPQYLIQNMANGILVPVGDVSKLADAMRTVLDNPQKAIALGKKAGLITNRLAPEKIYRLWEKFIREVVYN